MSTPRKYIPYRVNLSEADRERLHQLSQAQGKSIGETIRDAVRWYVDNHEQIQSEEQEAAYAHQLRNSTNRLAAMLYRISVATETLYEFQWSLLDDNSQGLFEACNSKAKTKLRKRLVQEEREVIQTITGEPQK